MSSHADTIRAVRFRADLVRRAGFDFYQAPQVAQDALAGLAGEMDKWAAALEAQQAENQRLRKALKAVTLCNTHRAAIDTAARALAGDAE